MHHKKMAGVIFMLPYGTFFCSFSCNRTFIFLHPRFISFVFFSFNHEVMHSIASLFCNIAKAHFESQWKGIHFWTGHLLRKPSCNSSWKNSLSFVLKNTKINVCKCLFWQLLYTDTHEKCKFQNPFLALNLGNVAQQMCQKPPAAAFAWWYLA